METRGLFIQRLRNFRNIRDLQKLFYPKSNGLMADGATSTSLGLVGHQTQSHTQTHLAAQAAVIGNVNPMQGFNHESSGVCKHQC